MAERVGEVLDRQVVEGLIGRDQELAALWACLAPDGPLVTFVHGVAGIGKSTLLRAFAAKLRSAGIPTVGLDVDAIEPTERGFLTALAEALGDCRPEVDQIATRLARLGTAVVVVDTYELLRLIDTWLRRTFVPSLERSTRLVLATRDSPGRAWIAAPEWRGLVHALPLGPLAEGAALEVLQRAGVPEGRAGGIQRFARGHPLSLELGAAAAVRHPGGQPPPEDLTSALHELSQRFLRDVVAETREALEACSVVRRVTLAMLEALLPERDGRSAFADLAALPFVRRESDGLAIHDAVRSAVAATLRAEDPERHRRCRRLAWRRLRAEAHTASSADLWRYTADMLYLIENPIVREAFFPSGVQCLTVEPARAADGAEILDIVRAREGPEETELIRYWWSRRPAQFHTVRTESDETVGFYFMLLGADAHAAPQDPLIAGWLADSRASATGGRDTLLIRRWLGRSDGELPSAIQAACWLDMKRAYMTHRPELRRVYLAVRDLAPYADAAQRLGFAHRPELDRVIDGRPFRTATLDFGPASVDGWLARLVADEVGFESDQLDHAARELVLDGRRIGLTGREYELLSVLYGRVGTVVARHDLTERVWGTEAVSSNVVDATVHAIRRKLGARADRLETVRGVGYRLHPG